MLLANVIRTLSCPFQKAIIGAILLFVLSGACLGQDINLAQAGSIETYSGRIQLSNPISVFVSGNYAYIANFGGNSLDIIEITNPANPKWKGRITHSAGGAQLDQPTSVFVSGNHAYVTSSGSNTLEIIDVSDPTSPVHMGSVVHGAGGALLKNPRSVFVVGSHAYIASAGSFALEIIDVADPLRPFHRSSLVYDVGSSGPLSVQVSGNHAYLVNSKGLEIVDVSLPGSPVHKGSIINGTQQPKLTLPSPVALSISGNFAYLVDDFRMEVVDVTNPAAPRSAGVLILENVTDARAVHVSGDFAFITCATNNTMVVVDVTYPKSPIQVGSLAHGTDGASLDGAQAVHVSGNFAYVVTRDDHRLEIVNVDIKNKPTHVAKFFLSEPGALIARARSIAVYNNYAYVANSSGACLEIVDLTNPLAPVHKKLLCDGDGGMLLSEPSSIVVHGGYAYVASKKSNALEILKLTDPANPVHAAGVGNGEGGALLLAPTHVFVSGNYAYVTSLESDALEIIDVTNPESPVHKGSLQNGAGGAIINNPSAVYVAGNYAYVTSEGSNALEIVNVSDPANPVHAGSIVNGQGGALLASPKGVFVSGNHAFISSSGSNALEIIDISNPASPVHRSSLIDEAGGAKLNAPWALTVSGNFAYLSSLGKWSGERSSFIEDRPNALEVVDITDPAVPKHKASIDYPGLSSVPTGLAISGDYLYLTRDASPGKFEIISLFGLVPPKQLTVSTVTSTSFTAGWGAVKSAQGYHIDVSTDNFVSFVTDYENRFVNTNSINIEGLPSDTKYQWRVRTKTSNGFSINSSTSLVWTTGPKALEASNISNTSFNANWESLDYVKSYYLDVSKDNFITFVSTYKDIEIGKSTSFTVTGLATAENYQYRLRAITDVGPTGYSNAIAVTTAGPKPPQALAATAIENYTFVANWSAVPDAIEYFVDLFYYNTNNSSVGGKLFTASTGNATSYSIPPPLIRNYYYAYHVRVRTAAGLSTNSNLVIVKTAAISRPPEAQPAIHVTENSFVATWIRKDEMGSIHYLDVVYDRNEGADNFVTGNFVAGFENFNAGTNTSALVSGLPGGTRFQYRVRSSYFTYGPSVNSEVISVMTNPVITGIENTSESIISIHPNPVSGEFLNITIKNHPTSAVLIIRNSLGQQIVHEALEPNVTERKVHVSGFPDGMYVAVIQTSDGLYSQKFLVKRL